MSKKKFSELSPEEGAASSTSEEFTHEERAAKYFEENPGYPFASVIVTDDGQIFPDTLKGDNSAFNYCGTTIGFKKIAKA